MLHRLDAIHCTTALEVELLAALVRERRLRLQGATKISAAPVFVVETKPDPPFVPPPPPPPAPPDPADLIPAKVASIWQIQCAVSRRFGFTVHDLKAARRATPICLARHVAVLLCHALTLYSYPHLGRYFDRDHSTLLHSVDKYRWLEDELRDELSVDDPLGLWSKRAHEKTVPKPVDSIKTPPELAPIGA
jgi:hypothetical protein